MTDDEGVLVTVRRWTTTTLAMGLVGVGLLGLAPGEVLVRSAVTAPQALVDTGGPDALLVLLAWALAALCWAWGVLGLVLTGLSTLPGLAGRVGATAVGVLLPAGLRRAAALAVGVSLVAGPVAGPFPAPGAPAATAVSVERATTDPGRALLEATVPDWPGGAPATPPDAAPVPDWPDWPDAPPEGAHVVVRGDVLWDIAEGWLQDREPGSRPSAASVAVAVQAWWHANADVVGPDPDLLLPGQVLTPPAP